MPFLASSFSHLCTYKTILTSLVVEMGLHTLGSVCHLRGSQLSLIPLYPGLLTPAFVACSTNVTNAGVRRPGYEDSIMSDKVSLCAACCPKSLGFFYVTA